MKKAAYITDIHLDEEDTVKYGADSRKNLLKILEHVQSTGADSIIFGGDIGFHTAHEWFFETMRSAGLGFYLTPGNHDKFDEV
ncbi:MAG: metallophosphoesterase, partial [Ignavibacteria bacterium]|nr:metallophosphoesterase [Ignavibacteria bacterium]